MKLKLLIVANDCRWQSWEQKIQSIKDHFLPFVELEISLIHTQFTNIPFSVYSNTVPATPVPQSGITNRWYDSNVTVLGKDQDIIMFVVNTKDWGLTNFARGWRTDRDEGPVELQVSADENEALYNNGQKLYGSFEHFAEHEITHALFMITGQEDITHEYDYIRKDLRSALTKLNQMNTLSTLKLKPPVANFTWKDVSQMFGVSHETYASKFNIPGHNGIDIIREYGTEVLASHDGTVIGISKDLSKQRGSGVVLQKILDDGVIVQTTYWHMSEVSVSWGDKITQGQIIGHVGNTGFVFPEPSDSCPHCGTHLHFALSLFKNGKPLFTDYGNFVDPVPYMFNTGDKLPIRFDWDLFVTRSGDAVSWLQTILKIEGFAQDYIPIGFFGKKTLRDVQLLQGKAGIDPMFGYVGSKTRKYLNEKYAINK